MFTIPNSILLVIDVQGNLAQAMHNAGDLSSRIGLLIKAAHIFDIPIICTEQVPQKLGKTSPDIMKILGEVKPIEKASFSAWGSTEFQAALKKSKRNQVIVTGIEAHVCVYQTVRDLLIEKFAVEVVTDAVSSRTAANKTIALQRMKDLGAGLTSTEMLVCELMKTAEYKNFREILSLIK